MFILIDLFKYLVELKEYVNDYLIFNIFLVIK